MPPVYKHVKAVKHFDGKSKIEMENLIYIPNALDQETSTKIFDLLMSEESPLDQHEYLGNFKRVISVPRLTYAEVPDRPFYRYKGKDLVMKRSEIISEVKSLIDCKYNFDSVIVNGYRYNGKDSIAPHVDDEKFLSIGNYPDIKGSCVFTYTFLRNEPMKYCSGDPETGIGYSIDAQHGSLIIQGPVLHEVLPVKGNNFVNRISVTLRKVIETCKHGQGCRKINCPHIYGPSNYLYYSCKV